MKSIFFLFSLCLSLLVNGQVNWNVNKTISLNPTVFQSSGSITVEDSKSKTLVSIGGMLTFFLQEKKLFFNDGKNSFDIKLSEVNSLNTDDFGLFSQSNLFSKEFSDSLLQHYRRKLYNKLSLNEITFSSSKRVEYIYEDGELKLKKQKLTKGKLCAVTLTNIVTLSEEGELLVFKDGDFNFLQMDQFRGFNCKSLYDYFFPVFSRDLKKNIDNWNQTIRLNSIEQMIEKFGPCESVINLTPEKKLLTWKKEIKIYYIDIRESSTTTTFSLANRNTYVNQYGSGWVSLFSSVPSAFLNTYTYRYTEISSTGQAFSTNTTSNSKIGKVWSKDNGYILSVIVDKDNKITNVYHENVFADPAYGIPFEFVDL